MENPQTLGASTLTGDLMAFVVETLKGSKNVWAKLSELEQHNELDRIQTACEKTIEKCIEIIATHSEHEIIRAQVDTVKFKKGATATLKIPVAPENDHAHSLARAEGCFVKILISHTEIFGSKATAPSAEPDQPALLDTDATDSMVIDPLYEQALDHILKTEQTSISSLQRDLRIGYNRAAKLISSMEANGALSPLDEKGRRKIFV